MGYYHYRYCLLTADFDYHITTHPSQQMRNLGFDIVKSEPFTIGDCWWFRTSNQVDDLPEYVSRIGDDFKFSDECDGINELRKEPPIYKPDGTLTDYGEYKFHNKIPGKKCVQDSR